MAFKMKGFNAGKGTGMSPNTMKKGSAMKMKKGSSMKKPLVGDQHKLPQELKAQIKQAPMTLGMRGNAMQGRDPNMAMKASNAMMPGSMMAMKKQNSAMTLKKGSDTKAKSRKAQSDSRTPDNQPSPGARSSANMREMSKRSGESTKTKRGTGLKINVAKAAREKAGQRKMKTMPSPMKLKEGAMSGAAISGVAGRKRTGDPERRLSKGGQKAKKGAVLLSIGLGVTALAHIIGIIMVLNIYETALPSKNDLAINILVILVIGLFLHGIATVMAFLAKPNQVLPPVIESPVDHP